MPSSIQQTGRIRPTSEFISIKTGTVLRGVYRSFRQLRGVYRSFRQLCLGSATIPSRVVYEPLLVSNDLRVINLVDRKTNNQHLKLLNNNIIYIVF